MDISLKNTLINQNKLFNNIFVLVLSLRLARVCGEPEPIATPTDCEFERNTFWNTRHSVSPTCDNSLINTTIVLPFLITCMGPCGSHHLAAEFWRAGIYAHHEAVGREGSISWMLAVDNRIPQFAGRPYPGTAKKFFLSHPNTVFKKVLHQTKCPLRTIAGFSTFLPSSFRHVSLGVALPLPKKMARLDCPYGDELEIGKGSLFCQFGTSDLTKLPADIVVFFVSAYIKWNKHIETYADWQYRIEDTSAHAVCLRTGLPPQRCTLASKITKAQTDAESDEETREQPLSHGHREHGTLTLSGIRQLNQTLGDELATMMNRYGYNEDCTLKSSRTMRLL